MAELPRYKYRKENICTGMFKNTFGNRGVCTFFNLKNAYTILNVSFK